MTHLNTLANLIDYPATSDADDLQASDALAAAIEIFMRRPAALQDKIEVVRLVERLGWDPLLPGYLSQLAAAAAPAPIGLSSQ